LRALLRAAQEELALSLGRIPGGRFAVVAMGKLGGREMTASSDLDLIFVYDAPEGSEHSDGARPQPLIAYYARLAQRLIAALTALTAEGGLYEVDMRLRPTGNKGPVAVSLQSFKRYHESAAWTWERLALTRARAIAGDPMLCGEADKAIRETLIAPLDRRKLFADAREMREKLAGQFPARNRWDLKFASGGLVDIEFVAQTLQLACARARPGVLDANTIGALAKLRSAGALDDADAEALIEAASLQQALTQTLRFAVEGTLDPLAATAGLKALLARAGRAANFTELELGLAHHQDRARAAFERLFAGA
jgi:glutamate-ammonia-ligase adenylyltransferase